jgi:hypothetical protein
VSRKCLALALLTVVVPLRTALADDAPVPKPPQSTGGTTYVGKASLYPPPPDPSFPSAPSTVSERDRDASPVDLRLEAGGGYAATWASIQGAPGARLAAPVVQLGLFAGGRLSRHISIGAAAYSTWAVSPSWTTDKLTVPLTTEEPSLAGGAVAMSFNGVRIRAVLGLAGLTERQPQTAASSTSLGFGGALGIGYDWRVGSTVRLGFLANGQYAMTFASSAYEEPSLGAARETYQTFVSTLLFTAGL